MQTWKINLELKVSDNLVADGVDFNDNRFLEKFNEHIREFISYAYYEIEFKVRSKVSEHPPYEKIMELQGY